MASECDLDLNGALARAEIVLDSEWWQNFQSRGSMARANFLLAKNGARVPIGAYIGAGSQAVVYGLPSQPNGLIKISWSSEPGRHVVFCAEQSNAVALERAGFDVAGVTAVQTNGVPYLIKEFVNGPSLAMVQNRGLSGEQIEALAFVYVIGRASKLYPDILGHGRSNLVWRADFCRWVLIDAGSEYAPAYFQPFDRWFDTGRRIANTLSLYEENVFAGDKVASEHFRRTARRLWEHLPDAD